MDTEFNPFASLIPERHCLSCGSKNVEYLRPGTINGKDVEPVPEGVESYKCRDCGKVTTWATPVVRLGS